MKTIDLGNNFGEKREPTVSPTLTFMQLTRLPVLDKASNCPALLLPPELWMYVLGFLERKKSPFNQHQLYCVAQVSSFFYEIALPLLYSQLTLFTYHPFARNAQASVLLPSSAIPATAAISTIAKRPSLCSSVKSIKLVGHIDIVILSRRTLTRTSEIVKADELRDLLALTLPRLVNLRSIVFNSISLTADLSTALFYLPRLEQLTLVDCRVPVPPYNIFRERPMDNMLVQVELSFGSWVHTPAELEFISAFLYGPKLKTLITNQSQVLLCLVQHGSMSKLSHLDLRRLGEKDAELARVFLQSQICSELQVLDLEDCQFPLWIEEDVHLPAFPRLHSYSGPYKLAHLFILPHSNVRHISLRDVIVHEESIGLDLRWLGLGGILSLDVYMTRSQFIDNNVWAMFRDSFTTLRVLRIHHSAPVELLQSVVLPMWLNMLPAMTCLEKMAVLPTAPLSDCGWHTSVVRDIARRQPALQEIAVSTNHVWLRLAKTEWKECRVDEL